MKEKKNPQYNLEKKRLMFLQFGLIFSFMLVLTAFEYKVPFEEPKDVVLDVLDDVDMLIPITYREPEKPIEPPQVKKIFLLDLVVVDDPEVDVDYNPEDSFGNPDEEIALLPVNNDIEEEEETPFVHAEFMPVFRPERNKDFKEGNLDLFKTLQTSVKYPVVAQESAIQGKVFVRFVVTKTGDISDITITRSVDPLLDNEVIRVLKSLPKFKPGMQRLKPVPVYYSAYVNFKLQ